MDPGFAEAKKQMYVKHVMAIHRNNKRDSSTKLSVLWGQMVKILCSD